MTHLKTDTRARLHEAVNFVLGILMMVFAGTAIAQVEVANSVAKVETYVDKQGVAQRRLVNADSVVPGDELRYTISFTNSGEGEVDAGSIVITNPVPQSTEYIDGTAFGAGTEILFSADQGVTFELGEKLKVLKQGEEEIASAKEYTTIQWQFLSALEPGETGQVSFNVKLK